MTQEKLITYFKSIAASSAEELYIERMFTNDFISKDDIEFLLSLQEKQLKLLQARSKEIDEALGYLSFDEKDILHTFEEEEETDTELQSVLFQEAFSIRNTAESAKNKDEAEKLKKILLNKK